MRSIITTVIICSLLWAGEGLRAKVQSTDNLPKVKQASLVESYSPTEWMIKAAGIGEGKKKEQEQKALLDARRSAVYFVLYLGTDPLLGTGEEKKRFAAVEQTFFEIENVMRFIVWESEANSLWVKSKDGKQLKIEKTFRVNVGLIKEDLINRGVLMAIADLTAELGMPQILVLPEVAQGENPLEALEQRPELKQAARTIESYLTAQRYEVIVPEQQDFLNKYNETLQLLKESPEDLSYQLALAIGSDVYITFSVALEQRSQRSSELKKAAATVRAFETTTARLLGSETGYSQERVAAPEAVAEEAVHDAIDKVLSRVNAYWKEDLQRGVQYKVICTIVGSFDQRQVEKIQDELSSCLERAATRSKENLVTDRTLDYLVWVKPDQFGKARDLFNELRETFALRSLGAVLERQQINRKLLVLQVVNQ